MGIILSGLLAFAGFLGLFHAIAAIPIESCIYVAPNLYLISNEKDLLLIFVCLAIAWLLGYFQKGNFSIRHIGTNLYGREQTKDGFVATKWLTIVFPILPIRSYIILFQISEFDKYDIQNQQYALKPYKGYFYFPQVLRTALISYGTLLWCWGSLWVMLNSFCFK